MEAAYMWRRHRLMVPFVAGSFLATVLVAGWVGWDDWPTRLAIGLAVAAVAVAASTDYRVLALTSVGLVLLKASRIRQAATGMLERLAPDVTIERLGGTVLATDWEVAGSVYTVSRSSEEAVARISARV